MQPGVVAEPEIELAEFADPVGATACDLVEHGFHACGELIGDQAREVLFKQANHAEGQPGRHQGRAFLVDVAAVENGADDGGVRRRTTDLALFEFLDQRGFGVASRGLGFVALSVEHGRRHSIAFDDVGQRDLGVISALGVVVFALDVRLQESVEGDHSTRRAKDNVFASGSSAAQPHRDAAPNGILHLGGNGAHPDQLIEAVFLARETRLRRRAK